jgi:outer membrane receptor protein involved in Fe transport
MRPFDMIALSSVSLAALVLASSPAYAQTPDPVTPGGDPCQVPANQLDKELCPDTAQQDPDAVTTQDVVPGQPDTGEAIVVTGSRIRRNSYNTGENITVVTRDESIQAGFNSTTDVLLSNSVTSGSAQVNNAFSGFVTDGGPGANTVSLRGLGPTRTLVLLNGRRIAPAGTRGSIGAADLNVLPTSIVDRIEVLKAGASSIYGSDAIAGVINVLTRTNVRGFTIEGQHNIPEVGDGGSRRYSVVTGYNADKWRVSGTVEWFKRSQMELGDRDFTSCPRDLLRTATDRTPGAGDFIDPLTGESKCYTISRTGAQGVTVNTIGLGGPFFGFTQGVELAPGFPPPPAPFSQVLCDRFRPDPTAGGSLPGFECVSGLYFNPSTGSATATNLNIRNTFDPRMTEQTLINPSENLTGFLQGSVDFGEAQFYAELLGTRRKSSSQGFRQVTLDYPRFSPLIPANLQFSNFAGPDANNLTSGQRIGVRGFIGFGNLTNDQEVDYVRAVGGVRGKFFLPDWKFDAFAMQSWTDAEYGQETMLTSRLRASMAVNSTGTACVTSALGVAPPPGCVPAPFLTPDVIAGNLPEAWRDFVTERVVGTTKFRETTIGGGVDGPVFALPGGDASVFVGAEWRKSRINDTPAPESQAGDLFNLTSANPTRGSDRVWEVFSEVELPFLKDAPLAHELVINASARHTNYRSYGSDQTWKVGGLYSPTRWLSFRGSTGTSYRAPALFEQFLGGTTGFLSQQSDPCNNYTAPNVDPTRAANCASEGLPPTFTATSGIIVITAGGAESGLEAETSKSWSVGGVLQPSLGAFGDLSFAVDYFRTEVNNGVDRAGAGNILARCYDDPDFRAGGGFCNLVTRNPSNNQLTVNNNYVNIATDIVRGIDFNVRHVIPLGPGKLRLGAAVTKFIDQANKLFEDDELDDFNGTINVPKWSGNFDVNYDIRQFTLHYELDWIDNMQTYDFLGLDPDTTPRVIHVPNYYLHHASVRWQSDAFGIVVGMRNIFDKNPPKISTGTYNLIGNSPVYSGYDYVGRSFFINVIAGLDKLGLGF